MKALFIGGSGIISSACSWEAVNQGIDLTILNRGKTRIRELPKEINTIKANVRDKNSLKEAIGNQNYDVIVDFIAFTPDQIQMDIDLLAGKTNQFVFISSASAYHKPVNFLPITESTPLYNPFWEYSRNKIACEELLIKNYRENGFPFTIVRPSHTYDKTLFPFLGGTTTFDRMLKGQEVVVIGDGTSLWTLTHHKDFAKGFVGLLGHPKAIGEAFHITSDEAMPWNYIYQIIADAANVPLKAVHAPSEFIAKYNSERGDSLIGDKMHSVIFDNSKLKRLVPTFKATTPYHQGAQELVEFYLSNPDLIKVNPVFNQLHEDVIKHIRKL